MRARATLETDAMTAWELFDKPGLSDLQSTAKKALQELVSTGIVQRMDKGIKGDPFRYFKRDEAGEMHKTNTRCPNCSVIWGGSTFRGY